MTSVVSCARGDGGAQLGRHGAVLVGRIDAAHGAQRFGAAALQSQMELRAQLLDAGQRLDERVVAQIRL